MYLQVVLIMRFIAFSNYLRVHIIAILLSFAEIAKINTRKNMSLMEGGVVEYLSTALT